MDRFGDVSALDDNVESLLSHDGGDGGNLYGALKQSPTENQKESSKGNPIVILHLWRSTIYLFFDIVFLQSPFQVSPSVKLVAYGQETAKLLAVIFHQMGSC